MDSSAFRGELGEISHHAPIPPPPSKLKAYGFAIAIIVGIGGIAVGAAGLAGYFHVGALSNMAQVDAIIMMAAGGGSGIILFIVGIVGTVKNRQSSSHQRHGAHVDSEHSGATRTSSATARTEIINSINTQNGSVYGPAAWKIWNVEVLDVVPLVPEVDLSKNDQVLLYIPKKIKVNGNQQNFNLNVLKNISNGPFSYFSPSVENNFGHVSAQAGWILIDRTVRTDSRDKNYAAQQAIVSDNNCTMPRVLEAAVLNLMVFAFTGERLYTQDSPDGWIYTCCIETLGNEPVVVGGFSLQGLDVISFRADFGIVGYGVACVRRL